MFLDDTACNLASINLLHYYDMDSQTFDVEGLVALLPALDHHTRD